MASPILRHPNGWQSFSRVPKTGREVPPEMAYGEAEVAGESRGIAVLRPPIQVSAPNKSIFINRLGLVEKKQGFWAPIKCAFLAINLTKNPRPTSRAPSWWKASFCFRWVVFFVETNCLALALRETKGTHWFSWVVQNHLPGFHPSIFPS